MRKTSVGHLTSKFTRTASVLVLGALVSACSSGVVRFSDGFYTGAVPQQPVGSVDTPYPAQQQQQVYRQPQQYNAPVDRTYTGSIAPAAPAAAPAAVTRQPISAPGVVRTTAPIAAATPPAPQPAAVVASKPVAAPVSTAAPSSGEGWTKAGGTYVTMRSGETVYNLAKRYGVPANAIMEANGITDAKTVNAGQQVIIPTYVYSRTAPISAPDNNVNTQSARSSVGLRSEIPAASVPRPGSRPEGTQVASLGPVASDIGTTSRSITNGNYTVVSGDTLSGIASRSGVSVGSIKRLNGLTSDNLRLGQSLLIPGASAAATQQVAAKSVDTMKTSTKPNGESKDVVAYTPPASKAAKNEQIASIDTQSKASAPDKTGVAAMRWPVQGRVVSAFGSNAGGKANDGIDISVPKGSPVKAAENGVVIYSGDGLKEFGKTVLVRHGDGLVTVYGHLDDINVKRGDTVKRGQQIAASGMSGSAKQPQLHFEVRKNTTPVNPTKYLN